MTRLVFQQQVDVAVELDFIADRHPHDRSSPARAAVVETMGLEPTTFWMQTRCSSQLSYVPVNGLAQDTSRRYEARSTPSGALKACR